MSTAIAKLTTIRTALEAAKSIDEMIDLRDQAAAVVTLAKAARMSVENVNAAMEIKLRTERKAGELLRGMERAGRGRKCNNELHLPSLSDLEISRMESSRWQTMSAVDDDTFDEFIEKHNDAKRELTSKALIQLGKQTIAQSLPTDAPATEDLPSGASVVGSLKELADQKFACIYADPPWQYGNQATRAATKNHYRTMTVDDLCEMSVSEFAADDSHLHLWTTNAFLQDAFRVMDAWGFEYRSCYVWVKPQMGIGNYWRVSHEFMLLGIRGNAKRFNVKDKMSWGEFPRTKHSAKPEEVRHLIEQVSNGPYLEIFGRRAVSGWTVLGNQVETRLFA
jgi:N6-adenosine-specific RNA methylase IME4